MRQSRIGIVGCLAFLLVLFGTSGWASAVAVNCATGNGGNINTGPLADAVVTQGFNGNTGAGSPCDLNITVPPTVSVVKNLTLTARSVNLTNTDIVGNDAGSTIRITATNGNIALNNATVKAHLALNFKCSTPDPLVNCTFTSSNGSEIVTATTFTDPNSGPGGTLIIDVEGDVNITNTAIHGGNEFKILSQNGNITIGPCPGGTVEDLCTDPLLSKSPPECFDPQTGLFKQCTITFTTPDQLRSVCFPEKPEPGTCNGGFKEKRFEAKNGFIDVRGVTLSAKEHMTFWCGPEGFLGQNSNLSSLSAELTIDCTRGPGVNGGDIHLEGATVSAPNFISLKTEGTGVIFCTGATFITPLLLQVPPSGC